MMTKEAHALHFLNGGGEMGERIRSKDWSTTPIGNPGTWPQSLQTAVSILLNSQFPMFVWWGKELVTIYNDPYRFIAGEKHPSLLGRSGKEAWAEIWPDLSPLVESVFSGKATWSEDQVLYMNRHGYVEETYFTFSYSPILDENGEVTGLFCACIETTEKVLATRKIAESERNLRATILQSPVAMCIIRGADFVVDIANERMFELWGRGAEDLLHKPIFEGLPEVRNQGLEELLHDVYYNGVTFTASERPIQLPRQGTIETVYVNFVYQPFREGDGSVSGIIAVATDVTEQVLARKKVEESERNFRNLVEQAPVAINVIKGPSYVMEIVNDSMLEILNRSRSEVLGKPVFESMPEFLTQGFEELLKHVYTTGERVTATDHLLQLHHGNEPVTKYINFVYQPLRDVEGNIVGLMTVAVDVTTQVISRRKIEESREELQLAIEIAELGTFQVNWLTTVAFLSDRVKDWFGFDSNEVSTEVLFGAIHPDDRQRVIEGVVQSTHTEENSQHDITYRVLHQQSGEERHLRSIGKTFFNEEGKAQQIRGVIQDVTQQILYQQKIEESEAQLQRRVLERTVELENLNNELKRTNANLEEFAYAASHDMKEPIRKIHLFSDRLKQELKEKLNDSQQHLFSRLENAALRMSSLIDDLLTYSHISKGMSHVDTVDLNLKVQNVLEDLEVEIDEKKAVIRVDQLPVITGHKRQMQQLFQNLIGNALKYSKADVPPQITITSKKLTGRDTPLSLPPDEADRVFYLVEVADNGIGFQQENAERIFNVFTRLHGNAEYRGTGVGLSIARKVVENHHGYIWAESKEGVGSTFKILLPAN